jgi:hypothetical protein
MIDRFLKSSGFDDNLRQERFELDNSDGADQPGNKSFDQNESLASGEIEDPVHEISNRLIVQPLVEGTVACVRSPVPVQFRIIHVASSRSPAPQPVVQSGSSRVVAVAARTRTANLAACLQPGQQRIEV